MTTNNYIITNKVIHCHFLFIEEVRKSLRDMYIFPNSTFTVIHVVIYCTRSCSHFHVMFDHSIVYNSCTHISCGVDIIKFIIFVL